VCNDLTLVGGEQSLGYRGNKYALKTAAATWNGEPNTGILIARMQVVKN
jgi:hypothetical protein